MIMTLPLSVLTVQLYKFQESKVMAQLEIAKSGKNMPPEQRQMYNKLIAEINGWIEELKSAILKLQS